MTQPARRPVYASFAVDFVRANRMEGEYGRSEGTGISLPKNLELSFGANGFGAGVKVK